jgi:hypothetical protein
VAYVEGAGYPTLVELRAMLKVPATVLPDEQLDVFAAGEQAAQRVLDWGPGDLPPDALDAFYRRVARGIAAKGVPLGVVGTDAEFGAVRLTRYDPEIDRLEAPYAVPVVS